MAVHFAYSPLIGCDLYSSGYVQPFDWLWLFTLHTALLLAVAVYLGYIQPFYFNRSIVSFGSGILVVPHSAPPPAPITGGSCHKYLFGRNKSFVVTNSCLSRQNMSFVTTKVYLWQNLCRNKHNFITTKVLLQQAYFCRNKISFVMTEICLSRQTFFHNKHVLVATNICHKKTFVATKSLLLWQQKTHFVMTNTNTCLSWQNFCCCKNYTSGSSRQW